MSIADKLKKIAENIPKVYEAGKSAGGGTGDSYDKGYSDGQRAEHAIFWDAFQENGNRTNYQQAFVGSGWNSATFYPKYDITGTSAVNGTFYNFNNGGEIFDLAERLQECGVVYDASQSTSAANGFYQARVSRIPAVSVVSATSLVTTFMGCHAITIDKLTLKEDGSNTFSNAFASTQKLVNITIEGTIGNDIAFPHSMNLSTESVQSIIDALADLTGQTAQTVTFHTDVVLRLTDEQYSQIEAKNWQVG